MQWKYAQACPVRVDREQCAFLQFGSHLAQGVDDLATDGLGKSHDLRIRRIPHPEGRPVRRLEATRARRRNRGQTQKSAVSADTDGYLYDFTGGLLTGGGVHI